MRYAIVDIGSNTIRMVTCTYENGKAEISGNERISSIILRCIKNDRLTFEGINFLIDSLNHMKQKCGVVDNIYAFATASLRGITNSEEVCAVVAESTGINIRLISGDEEAEYDFYSLVFLGKTTKKGMGIDLGGGSCQMFTFDNDTLINESSMMIGSARIHDKFVENDIPTPEESKRIYEYIYSKLDNRFCGFDSIYAIGGSARCALALYNIAFDEKIYNEISVNCLERLCKYMIENPDTAYKILKSHFSDRVQSLLPGVITLLAICKYVGAEKLIIAVCGVREGFIFKEIMQ